MCNLCMHDLIDNYCLLLLLRYMCHQLLEPVLSGITVHVPAFVGFIHKLKYVTAINDWIYSQSYCNGPLKPELFVHF